MAKLMKCALILMLSLSIMPEPKVFANEEFASFLDTMFAEMMQASYIESHFLVSAPENYGYTASEPSIGEFPGNTMSKKGEKYQAWLTALKSYDYQSLSESEKTDYECVRYYLESELAVLQYPDCISYLSTENDAVMTLINDILLFEIQNEAQADDYIALLSTIPDYVEELIKFEKKRADTGAFITETAADTLVARIDALTDDDDLLYSSFTNKLRKANLDKEELEEENKKILGNSVIPAFRKLRDFINEYRTARKYGNAVCDMPDGAEYYAAILRRASGIDASPEHLFDIVDPYLRNLAKSYKGKPKKFELKEMTGQEMIEELKSGMDDFPDYPEVDYAIEAADAAERQLMTGAYYVHPKVDQVNENLVRVRDDKMDSDIDSYMVVAHETYPGHMYQITRYMHTSPHAVRAVTAPLGYAEGWAEYSIKYALETIEMPAEEAEQIYAARHLNYMVLAVADIGINGLGWSEQYLEDYLYDCGIPYSSAGKIYDTVTASPTAFIPYGIGAMMFWRLYGLAAHKSGEKTELKEFHEVLLNGGGRPFSCVSEDVYSYLGLSDSEIKEFETVSPAGKVEHPETKINKWYIAGAIAVAVTVLAIIGIIKKKIEENR